MDKCAARLGSEVSSLFIESLNRGFEDLGIKTDDSRLKYFRQKVRTCNMCANGGVLPVSSFGSVNSKYIIVDSNPGKIQTKEGNAATFGALTVKGLIKILSYADLSIQDCYVTYAFHCRTPERTIIQYDRCSLWFNYELSLLKDARVIITLGEDALHFVMGEGYPRLVDNYGAVYHISVQGIEYLVLPVMHPWFLMRHPEWNNRTAEIIHHVKDTIGA